MTAQEFAAQVFAIGTGEIGTAVLHVLPWIALGTAAAVYLWGLVRPARWVRERRHEPPALAAAPQCPCCTGEPYKVSDCTCRDDCGVEWCQAAEPPCCPWCDTHACIDRTMCNCEAACGSWLCEAGDKEASRG